MPLTIEIIGIGDELVSGRVVGQNAGYAAARLNSFGFEVNRIILIGDQPKNISFTLKQAGKRADAILVTGGLGGTLDDITVEVVKACGFMMEEKGKLFFFLPGIPEKMKSYLDRQIIPYLVHHSLGQPIIRQRIYNVFGLLEPEINERFKDLEKKFETLRLGFYPKFPENQLTISVRSEKALWADRQLDSIEKVVEERLSGHLISKNDQTLEEVVGGLLLQKKMTLSVAESCTGGLIGHRITGVGGSSAYFDRSLVVYSNRAKMEMLDLPKKVLSRYGAVSEQTALLMAEGIRKKSKTDLGLAVTGIAGPGGGTPEKPVGTVWIALASSRGSQAGHFLFQGRRNQIKILTAYTALNWVRRYLLDDTFLFSH